MIVFHYDKTFEGLLTALFDAYTRKEFPGRLLAAGEIDPLFAESYEVMTQKDKASRVWAGVEKKLGRRACNMVLHVWLSEQDGCDELLFRFLRKVFDRPGRFPLDFADPDTIEVEKLARKVAREGEHVRQFVRWQKGGDGSWFGATAPKYNALPLAIKYFKNRFADQKWLIYDTQRHYGYYYDLKEAVEVTMEDDRHLLEGWLSEDLLAGDEKFFQELWRNYFKSLTIKERINPKLHRQMMPERFWKYLVEKQ